MAKKNYAFYYTDKDTIYMQVGFDSFEAARSGLEQIARVFANERASGIVDEINRKGIVVVKEYDISYENGKIGLKVKK